MTRKKLLTQGSLKTAVDAFTQIEMQIEESGVDAKLRHLLRLRVSQINGCVYCVGMHTAEARRDGESNERLDKLVVWTEAGVFSPAEKAALAWSEALTLRGGADLDRLYAELSQHFDTTDIATLTLIVTMINNWNRLQIASHHGRF